MTPLRLCAIALIYFVAAIGWFVLGTSVAARSGELDGRLSSETYLRGVAGSRIAAARASLAQLMFLMLFSGAFFFEGCTGLTVTIGAIVTLFVLMQATVRVDWTRVFATEGAR
jgi:hypothetical protein